MSIALSVFQCRYFVDYDESSQRRRSSASDNEVFDFSRKRSGIGNNSDQSEKRTSMCYGVGSEQYEPDLYLNVADRGGGRSQILPGDRGGEGGVRSGKVRPQPLCVVVCSKNIQQLKE